MVANEWLDNVLCDVIGVDEPGSTSLLGVGLVVVIALLFLIELLFNWWMVLVIPVAIFFYLIRRHLLMGMTFGVLGKRS